MVKYNKPALTYKEQLNQLLERGLEVVDHEKAIHLLEKISYYRLSAYWHPFLQIPKTDNKFKPGSSFEKAFKLYCFDRELRQVVFNDIEKIEVAVRAKMVYRLSHEYGPNWYTERDLYKSVKKHTQSLLKIIREVDSSKEDFILAFKKKYSNELPPSWMALEITSFGTISHLYSELKPSRAKREVAEYFGLDDKSFSSWLHTLVHIRNVCAHHSRFWNRAFRISPQIPRKPKREFIDSTGIKNNKSYYILSMIQFLLIEINPKSSFKHKIDGLFEKYPMIDKGVMGFPSNWEQESIWSK
jgi:abortive infection bacteriophage resistance protein